MFNTYILPIIEYGIVLFDSANIESWSELYRLQRDVTRIALRAPTNPIKRGYIPFETRLLTLGQIKLVDRKIIIALTILQRIWKSTTESPIKVILNNAIYDGQSSTRAKKIFQNCTSSYVRKNTPLYNLMMLANKYAHLIAFDGTIEATKNSLKREMLSKY